MWALLLDFASTAYNPADQSGPHSADVFWYKVVRRDTYCIVLETYWESAQETTNQLASCAKVLATRYSLSTLSLYFLLSDEESF